MRVAVIGTGYVGLVSGACLAEKGHDVACVDLDPAKVEAINAAAAPIHEAGLAELLRRNVPSRLRATTDLASAVRGSDVSLLAVGTPFDGRRIDLRQVKAAAKAVGKALRRAPGFPVVVVKSTVVPGTTEEVVLPLLERWSGKKAGEGFGVGMNPEFLREGSAVEDFLHPDRIVLGALENRSAERMAELYRPFPGVDVVRTTPRTAEAIKYASNSLLASLISFSNEMAGLCQALGGVDVREVLRGVHLDRRLSTILPQALPAGRRVVPAITTYLEAGCGFGGSCFPKDVQALIAQGRRAGRRLRILEEVMEVNRRQPLQMLALLQKRLPALKGRKVAVLGLSFKPGTDDLRESPAFPIIAALLAEGAEVTACDPVSFGAAAALLSPAVRLTGNMEEAVREAEAVLLVTAWPQFGDLPAFLKRMTPPPVLVDGRRMFDRGVTPRYEGIGLS